MLTAAVTCTTTTSTITPPHGALHLPTIPAHMLCPVTSSIVGRWWKTPQNRTTCDNLVVHLLEIRLVYCRVLQFLQLARQQRQPSPVRGSVHFPSCLFIGQQCVQQRYESVFDGIKKCIVGLQTRSCWTIHMSTPLG